MPRIPYAERLPWVIRCKKAMSAHVRFSPDSDQIADAPTTPHKMRPAFPGPPVSPKSTNAPQQRPNNIATVSHLWALDPMRTLVNQAD
jgi:hypothetical protein